jgi:zinc protease
LVIKRISLARWWLALVIGLGSVSAYAIPDIQTWQTDNGAKVLYVPSMGLPMADIRIVFDAGSARDNGISGLAALTNGLLAEGAGGKTAQELAEGFESVGAQLENDSLRDMAIVSVRTLTDKQYLDKAVDTLSTLLTKPDFNQKEYERELARMKVSVESRKQSPSSIAEEAFYKAVYGDHPYAEPSGGTEESLEQLSLDSIKAFYKQYYVAKNAVIVIVGQMDQKQAAEIADRLTAGLPTGEKPIPLPKVSPLTDEQIIKIEYPSKQSHIYVGQPGTKRGDEDHFALYIGNHPFGGSGFASRLVETIREDRGLAYSVYSYFSPMREAGPFMMGMQTRADQTDEAVSLLKSELLKYINEGPDKDELKDSVSNIVGSFPLNLDSNSKLLSYLAMIGFYDLPEDYLQTFVSNVEAVSRNDIKDALKRRLHTDKMVTVIVGNGGE